MSVIVDQDKCIGCESCVSICPTGALVGNGGKVDVDKDACVSCGACIGECPVEAIVMEGAQTATVAADGTDIWVFAETFKGEVVGVVPELLGQAMELAAKSGQKACAVLLTNDAKNVPAELIAAGADKVYVVENEVFAQYNTEYYTNAICELAQEFSPSAIMIGATEDGRDLAPRVAARLNTGLCADCTALDITDGIVEWTRPALGGNILATILCSDHRPQMGTVRPKVFKALEVDTTRTGEVITYALKQLGTSHTTVVEEKELIGAGDVKIEDAEIICSGGRGMQCEDTFKLLEELAEIVGGTTAGSRAAVDEGWVCHAQQVGQSGKTVTPKIYFACGISGAIQHLSGMTGSDLIIAINKDPKAPIFQVAQYGLVGDVKVVLPMLIEKIRAIKEA